MVTRIAIIGAGIGGLVLAVALKKRNIETEVFEQAHELAEIGAAVALSANGTRELERLGLLHEVEAVSTEPSELIYRDGKSGERVAAHPVRLGDAYRKRFGAPYCGIHRAELQRILGAPVRGAGLHLAHKLVSLDQDDDGVTLHFGNGAVSRAELVIASDGIRSVAREHVAGRDPLRYSGTSGFRGIVPVSRLPLLPDPQAIQFWMGLDAHLLHYAIGPHCDHVNFLAVVEGPARWPTDKGLTPSSPREALAHFEGWHPALLEMIDAVRHDVRWGLFITEPFRPWRRGRVVLLGDAAHGSLPHHGQGANATIEDSIALAAFLDTAPDIERALQGYERIRRIRTRMIQRASWAGSRALHLAPGPERDRRDARLQAFPEWFGWIHGYDARESGRRAAGH